MGSIVNTQPSSSASQQSSFADLGLGGLEATHPQQPEIVNLLGSIERIKFQKADFVIATFLVTEGRTRITIKGNVVTAVQGQEVELTGHWVQDPKWGRQFEVMHSAMSAPDLPSNLIGLSKWMSEKVPGVGPVAARHLVEAFGDSLFAILDLDDPAESLARLVTGVPAYHLKPEQIQAVVATWHADRATGDESRRDQEALRNLIIFLFSHNLGANVANRASTMWGAANAQALIQSNPYRLTEIDGVGFKTADSIGQALGFGLLDPRRIRAGAVHSLVEAANEGHTYLPYDRLVEVTVKLIGVEDTSLIIAEVGYLVDAQELISCQIQGQNQGQSQLTMVQTGFEQTALFLPKFDYAERIITSRLKVLAQAVPGSGSLLPSRIRGLADVVRQAPDPIELIRKRTASSNFSLNDTQLQGVVNALLNPVSILTGGPGTGKTTSMRALLDILTSYGYRVALAAPTGRAAKRLAVSCGSQYADNASTIHRLIGMQGDSRAEFNDDNPLPYDFVVLDEASMVDTVLFERLVRAIPSGAHLLLVGDSNQLPSVGPGNVLADLIGSELYPVTRLVQLYRQSEDSFIAANAEAIRNGQMPQFAGASDFYFFEAEEATAAAALIVELVTKRIPDKFNFRPGEIQVLAPMRGGPCGVEALNKMLQTVINPAQPGVPEIALGQGGRHIFRQDDAVMHLKNDYDRKVFNGDTGRIGEVVTHDNRLVVALDAVGDQPGERIEYKYDQLEHLVLSYAMTIHKSQGSEYPVVVMPVLMSHYIMLQRTLFYTGVTRGKKLVVLVGQKKALAMAIANNKSTGRFTGLRQRLQSA